MAPNGPRAARLFPHTAVVLRLPGAVQVVVVGAGAVHARLHRRHQLVRGMIVESDEIGHALMEQIIEVALRRTNHQADAGIQRPRRQSSTDIHPLVAGGEQDCATRANSSPFERVMATPVPNREAVEQVRHRFDFRNQFDVGQAKNRNPELFEKNRAVLAQPSQSTNQDGRRGCSKFVQESFAQEICPRVRGLVGPPGFEPGTNGL